MVFLKLILRIFKTSLDFFWGRFCCRLAQEIFKLHIKASIHLGAIPDLKFFSETRAIKFGFSELAV